MVQNKKKVGQTTNENVNDNSMVVKFETVDGYIAALEEKRKEQESDLGFIGNLHGMSKAFIGYIKDYKGFKDDADYNKYLCMGMGNFNPLKYLRLKYLQHDTSARNKIGGFIAGCTASDGSIIYDMQQIAKVIVRHADKFTDNMEVLDLCYYINYKLEEKED